MLWAERRRRKHQRRKIRHGIVNFFWSIVITAATICAVILCIRLLYGCSKQVGTEIERTQQIR
jgi:hypothetical protein